VRNTHKSLESPLHRKGARRVRAGGHWKRPHSGNLASGLPVHLHTDSLAVRLEVVLRHDRLRVSVYDDALDSDPQQKPGDAYDENGRGLLLLTGLARDWGVRRGATTLGTPAKQIWFELGGTGTGTPSR
jgi:hypothetical protein